MSQGFRPSGLLLRPLGNKDGGRTEVTTHPADRVGDRVDVRDVGGVAIPPRTGGRVAGRLCGRPVEVQHGDVQAVVGESPGGRRADARAPVTITTAGWAVDAAPPAIGGSTAAGLMTAPPPAARARRRRSDAGSRWCPRRAATTGRRARCARPGSRACIRCRHGPGRGAHRGHQPDRRVDPPQSLPPGRGNRITRLASRACGERVARLQHSQRMTPLGCVAGGPAKPW